MGSGPDQSLDVQDWLAAIIREAHRDADAVVGVLRNLGFAPGAPNCPSGDVMPKIAALVRLRRWEHSGLRDGLPADLPPSDDVLTDLVGGPARPRPRYGGAELLGWILQVQLSQMEWRRCPAGGADLSLPRRVRPDEALDADAVARFLRQFRHPNN